MNLNNNKLRNILAMVVALTLVILPNLVAVADSTEGVQGTPTPTFTSESVDATPSETPAQETSASPTNTSTSEDAETTPSASPSSEADTNEPTATPSVSPSETPAEAVPEASPSESPPVGIPEAAPSETPPIDTPEASPSETPPVEFPESVPSETPPTDTPEATPSETPPTDTPETTPSETPPTDTPETTPSETPPADTPEAAEPTANFEAARVRTSTVQFSNNPNQGNAHDGYGLGLSHYTYEVKVNGTYQAPVRVSPSGPSDSKTITFPIGAVIRIKAYPKSGYTFKQWWRDTDNHGSSNPFVYTVPGNAFNVQALFLGPQPTATPAPTSTPPPIISGTLTIYKEDARGHSLSGASFTLVKDGTSTPISPTSVNGGTFRWVNLPEGDYTLTETSAPSGYQIDGSGVYSVHIGPQSSNVSELEKKPHPSSPPNWDVSKHIENEKISVGSIKVYKKNQDGEKISGATFTLTPAGGGDAITLTETSRGVHKAGDLTPGDYTLTETVVPSGYTGSTSQQVTIQGDREKRLTVVNTKPLLGSIKVYKKDQDGERIYGATFTLTPAGGGDAITLTETSRGVHKAGDLTPGDYTLTETVVPSGYTGASSQQVTIRGDREKRVTVLNTKLALGSLTVKKVDANGGAPLSGASFTLVKSGTSTTITGNDNGSGTFTWADLEQGDYTLTETSAPSGYKIQGNGVYQISITSSDLDITKTISNDKNLGSLKVYKKDSVSNEMLDGATFKLVKDSAPSTQIAGNDDGNGTFTWTNLEPGSYTLTETGVPTGYYSSSTSQSITISAGSEEVVTVLNDPYGSLTVLKKDSVSGELLDGAIFRLVKLTDTNTPIAGNNDGNGTFTWTNLLPGEYTLTETGIPTGYYSTVSKQNFTISAGAKKVITVQNDPYGSLKVLKKDSVSGKLLDGATFKLVKDSAPSTAIAGNDNGSGTFTWTNLVPGEYTLTETSAPNGYYASSSSQSVTISAGAEKELTVLNDPYGSLKVLKKDSVSGELLDGAAFKLVLDTDPRKTFKVTDDGNGTFTWADLIPGDYTLTEESVPSGYYVSSSSQSVTLSKGEDKELTVQNDPYGSLTVLKKDSVSGELLDGAAFKLVLDSDPNTELKGNDDGNGTFTWTDLLPGDYTLTEEDVPTGYYVASSSQRVTLTQGEDKELTVLNDPYGSLKVLKKDSVSGELLDGATFKLVKDSAPSTEIAGNNDGNGTFTWTDLLPGDYTLTEEGVPTGYYDANYSLGINLTQGEDRELTVNNEKFVSITVLKRSAVTELPLAGAVFSIEAVSSNDNVRVQNVASTNVIGGVLGTVTTGSDGTATFAFPAFQLRAGVRYLIKEVTPPYGYLNDSTPVYVTVDTPGGTNEEVALFENNPDYGTVVVAKFQAGSNNQVRLGGVRFSLYRDSVSPGNLVGTQYTDANGNIVWNSQFAGNFVLVEEATIAGYSLPANPATAFTLLPGERKVIILQNVGGPTPTPTPPPPANPPEATPTATSSPTPVPTATPTPINTDEFIIDDVAPAFGPETGEGDFLFILMGILALIGGALLIIRKKLVLKQ